MNEKLTKIYTLSCPITGEIKYVGKTIQLLEDRLRMHIYETKRTSNKRTNWIKSLLAKDLKPIISLLEEVGENWAEREQYWIAHYRSLGCNLKNDTIGGEGCCGRVCSEETRNKIRKSNTGRKYSEEAKKNMSEAHIGKSVVIKGKTWKEFYGVERAQEIREKIINSKRGVPSPLKGKTLEEVHGEDRGKEIREKLRTSHLGQKSAYGMLGKKASEKTREKQSIAIKSWWQIRKLNEEIS